ncbi:uncharacterized protein LOC134836271 [Culicoides brevitarsis]|uniref:uncharacterized protein LOC134836271 n=1 Tax=Culicoides brevitarsis TaxID=469753 RepID=UPI00307BD0B0
MKKITMEIRTKLIISVFLWLLLDVQLISCGVSMNQLHQTAVLLRQTCQPKFKLTDEQADIIRDGTLPDYKDGKCYLSCLLEMLGVMKKGKLMADKAIKTAETMLPDEMRGEFIDGINICKDLTYPKDACETGAMVAKCAFDNIPSFFLPMTEENFEQLAGVLRSKCMKVVKVTPDVPLAIADGDFDESNRLAKCYVQCVMDTLKIMDKKGKLTYLKSIQDTYIPDDWKESFGNSYKMCVSVANDAKLTDKFVTMASFVISREFLSLVFLMTYITLCLGGATSEQMEKTAGLMRTACTNKLKVSDAEAQAIKEGNIPTEKAQKCYVHCVFEMMGAMKKAKVNYDGMIKQIDTLMPDEVKETTKRTFTLCKDSANGIKDPCDAGTALLQCMKDKAEFFTFA